MNESSAGRAPRNYGIDLLRIVLMMMVVTMHVLGQGGILSRVEKDDAWSYGIVWLLESAAYCAVDGFALISGYVGWRNRFRISKVVLIWLETAFYTVILTAAMAIFYPERIADDTWLTAFFPILKQEYWYITAYFGLMLAAPLLNAGIEKLSGKELGAITAVGAVVFVILPMILDVSVFGIGKGYSMMWLCILYVAGGIMDKYGIGRRLKPAVGFAIFSVSSLIVWGGHYIGLDILRSYVSPFVIMASVGLVIAFGNMRIKRRAAIRFISVFSPAALAVFLIHVHTFVWYGPLDDFAVKFIGLGAAVMTLAVIGSVIAIWLACSLCDLFRIWLFRVIGLKKLLEKADGLLK